MDFILAGAMYLDGDRPSKRNTVIKVACPKPMVVGNKAFEVSGCNCITPCKICHCKIGCS